MNRWLPQHICIIYIFLSCLVWCIWCMYYIHALCVIVYGWHCSADCAVVKQSTSGIPNELQHFTWHFLVRLPPRPCSSHRRTRVAHYFVSVHQFSVSWIGSRYIKYINIETTFCIALILCVCLQCTCKLLMCWWFTAWFEAGRLHLVNDWYVWCWAHVCVIDVPATHFYYKSNESAFCDAWHLDLKY